MNVTKFAAVILGLSALPALAHHGFNMFEMEKDVTYDGVVLEFKWENPHAHVVLKVPPGVADASTVGTWDIEGAATNIMSHQGWTKATLKPGDHIKAIAHPMKDGSKGAALFYVILPDGKRMYQDIARPKTDESKQAK